MPRCSVVWAVFTRNLAAYFTGMLGPLIILVFVVADAARTFNAEFFANNLATLDQLTKVFPQLLLFVIPAITMGVWADERRQGTDELLFTMPATDFEILLGKYKACLAFYTIALGFTIPKLMVLEYYANPDWSLLLTTYLGYWLAGAALIGAGMFASSLVSNTTAAYVLGGAFCSVPVFIGQVSFGNRVVESLSLSHHLGEFGVGLVSLGGLVYFASFSLLVLYLNYVVITRRHWSADRSAGMGLHYAARILCLVVALVSINYAIRKGSEVSNLRYDATAEGLHTLTAETAEIIRAVPDDSPIEITAFVSPDLPRDHVDQGRALERLLQQYRRIGADRLKVRVVEAEPHTAAADEAETFGIAPQTVDHEDQTGQRRDDIFLGAVVTGARGEVVVPYIDPEASVEYELTRAIATVTQRERLRVGLLETPAGELLGSNRGESSGFVNLLEKHYEVDTVFAGSAIELDREIEFAIWTDADQEKWDAWKKREDERKAKEKAAAEAEAEKAAENADDVDPDADAETDKDDADEATDDASDDSSDAEATDGDDASDDVETDDEPADEKPREKPEKRSQYLEGDPSDTFDEGTIPEDFTKKLGWRGIHLSGEAKLTVVQKGRWWRIDDVNPTKSYKVVKGKDEITVSYPRFDVVVAVMPSGLTAEEMTHLVDYVESGRPVLIFDDPVPLHLGGFLGLEQAPSRPRRAQQPQSPGMPAPPAPEKANGGEAKSLMEALDLVWQYDVAVWDEFDPHPKHREFPAGPQLEIPLLYVNGDNGTSNALDDDSPVTAGLRELQFIYPGRVNPRTGSRFDFQSLVRVGPESGIYSFEDIVTIERNPFAFGGGPTDAVGGMKSNPGRRVIPGYELRFDIDDTLAGRGYQFVLDERSRDPGDLNEGLDGLDPGEHRFQIYFAGDVAAEMTIVLEDDTKIPVIEVTAKEDEVEITSRDSKKDQPRRTSRFCLAAHVSAPRRIAIEVDLPEKDSDETQKKLDDAIAKALGEIEGIEAIDSRIEERLGRSIHVTLVDVSEDIVDPDEIPADPEAKTDADGSDNEAETEKSTEEPKKKGGPRTVNDLADEIETQVGEAINGIAGKPRVLSSEARSAIFVSDVDMIGNLPLLYFEDDPTEEIDFHLDNSLFVLNAIDVLAGRTELVGLQSRRARHRILTEIERRKQQLDAATTEQIRVHRRNEENQIAEFEERVRRKQERLREDDGLTSTEKFQEQVVSFRAASANLDRQLEEIEDDTEREIAKLRAENRREVIALQNDIRRRAIIWPLLPAILFAVGICLARFISEKLNVDPNRSRSR